MELIKYQEFFLYGFLINFGILLYWAFMMMLAKKFVYRMHRRFFSLSDEEFDKIHYAAMAFYKLAVFMMYLVPYIVISVMI